MRAILHARFVLPPRRKRNDLQGISTCDTINLDSAKKALHTQRFLINEFHRHEMAHHGSFLCLPYQIKEGSYYGFTENRPG